MRTIEAAIETRAVADAERALAAAHLTLDLAVLDRLFHHDYVIVQPDGGTETKADVLTSFQTGERQWNLAEVDQLDIRVYGAAAVVIGRWRATGHNRQTPFDYAARFLSLWVNDDGRWQNVAYQSTEIPFEDGSP
ncbi:MAG: nuclear transport factor 2 family protein [Chloroflexia bacterium]|nr:nuclear transport factor 2 family protein [Chloroflexia bacterium]